jgi:hypothetical protein
VKYAGLAGTDSYTRLKYPNTAAITTTTPIM